MTYQKLKEMLDKMSPEELEKSVQVYVDEVYCYAELMRDEDYPEDFIFLV